MPLLREGYVDFDGHFYSARGLRAQSAGATAYWSTCTNRWVEAALAPSRGSLRRRVPNAGYYSRVETFTQQRVAFETAREEVGRQRVEISATLKVAWEDLGNRQISSARIT